MVTFSQEDYDQLMRGRKLKPMVYASHHASTSISSIDLLASSYGPYIIDDGYYVGYKPITLPCILFMFIEMKFIHCHSCVMFAMKSMSMCND